MSAAPARTLEYRLLGGFRLSREGAPVAPDAWQRPMAARLARFLLVHRECVLEDQLLDTFWPDRDPAAARRCLAVSVSRCRAVIRPGALVCSDRAYRLVLDPDDRVDVDAFEHASALALAEPSGPERLVGLERAARLWTGEPLPEDRYADWARVWRDALDDRHREVLAALSDVQAEAGAHDAALRAAHRMLAADPLDEGAHRRVMAGYAALGRRNRALEQYLRCRRVLVDALGIEPARETAALHARILAGEETVLAA
jgi:DNA-binding SARP family transcriptional activator